VTVGLLVALIAVACGDGDGGVTTQPPSTTSLPTTSETTTTSATTTLPTAPSAATISTSGVPPEAGDWAELLGWVPADQELAVSIVINDYAAARESLGIDPPGDDPDEVMGYLLTLTFGPIADPDASPVPRAPAVGIADDSFGRTAFEVEAWRTALGLAVPDVDRSLVAGVPPGQLTVWEGRFDPGAVAAAVALDPEWSADLRTVEHAGGSYYAWGDDPDVIDLERVGSVRPLGRGGCLYASDALAMRTVQCDLLEQAIDAGTGVAASLGDVEVLARLAEAVQDAGAHAAFLTTDVGVFAVGGLPDLTEDPELEPGLRPYLAAATGVALDGDTPMLVVALVHGDADDAAENATRLQGIVAEGTSAVTGRPWSEILTVDSIEVEGQLLVARLATESNGTLWIELVARRDSLLAWG
jgi:hypothetical protein